MEYNGDYKPLPKIITVKRDCEAIGLIILL